MTRLLSGACDVLARALGALAIVAFALLALDVLWGVASRYVLGAQSQWTDELATLLMLWVALAGAAVAYRDGAHLGVDALVSRMDPATQSLMRAIAHALSALFALLVLVVGGSALVLATWRGEQFLPALGVNKAWMYAAIPIGGLAMLAFAVEGMLTRRREPADAGAGAA